ncbi:MAG: hypothetical protein J6Y20_14875 [Lachnospiraceae bacterium]|nr:hypothetical protein [Lachnospiraceae bacterium]
MKKSNKKRTILIVVIACIVVMAVFAVLVYLDYSGSHEVVKLGRYKGLTVSASGADSPEDALVEAVVKHTIFGRALKQTIEDKYNDTMNYFESEAEYFQISLEEHVEKYYNTNLEDFRKTVRSTTEETVKQTAVLHAIAEKENIKISDEEYETALPMLMSAHGYTDRSQFLREIDVESLLDELLQEKVINYLLEQNTVTEEGK